MDHHLRHLCHRKARGSPPREEHLDGDVAIPDARGSQFVLDPYADAMIVTCGLWLLEIGHDANLAKLWWYSRSTECGISSTTSSRSMCKWDEIYGKEWPKASVYRRHIYWLEETVPADCLVLSDVKEGWEPLSGALRKVGYSFPAHQ